MFGYSAAEMVGQSIRRLIPDDRQQEEDEVLSRIRRGERVEHYETIRRRKDGTLIPVSLTVSPIRGHGRHRDRRVEDRPRHQRAEARGRGAPAAAGHRAGSQPAQGRIPRDAVARAADAAERDRRLRPDDAVGSARPARNRRARWTPSRATPRRLTQIVEDVLDVSRIISGKLRLDVQPVDLPDVDSADASRPSGRRPTPRASGWTRILDPRASPVSGDPERLQQILWNLLSNAVKFTPRGGRVQVRLERVELPRGNHRQRHRHRHPGRVPAARLRPLPPGGCAASTAQHGGLGLGLAITRHLVELQGGRILADSDGPGKGATFRIDLPLRIVQSGFARGARTSADAAHGGRHRRARAQGRSNPCGR